MGKNLKEIIDNLNITKIVGNTDIMIDKIAYHTKDVIDGTLFVCIKGFKVDGHNFAELAIQKGAVGLVLERDVELSNKNITKIFVKDSRSALAKISAAFYDFPSRKMKVIGVTGTNGKTTICNLIGNIIRHWGKKVGIIGTLGYQMDDDFMDIGMTTPESLDLQRLFNEMVKKGMEYVVMEVSSHSLELKRVDEIPFYGGVFTNLTQDHLDYHGTMENYRKAKEKLFCKNPEFSSINIDDESGKYMLVSKGKNVTYGINNQADYKAEDLHLDMYGVKYTIIYNGQRDTVVTNIPGKTSVYNSLAAFSLCHAIGVPTESILESLKSYPGVPGRLEVVNPGGKFSVIVDYSHTPDSLQKALETIKEFTKGKIISIFGCGGDRDRTKRPIMGSISTSIADISILTSDNPRSENPLDILKDIEEGAKKNRGKYYIIEDRGEAIRFGINLARDGDVVLIAGKGHETYQEFKDGKVPFDDRIVAREFLKEMGDKNDFKG